MLQRFNRLDLPDWFEHCHWMREVVCVSEPYVEGDLTLYPDGDAKIGTRMFRTGIPIDDWPFAGSYIAKRRIDRPEWLVIRTPAGVFHYYRYRAIVGMWERYSPFEDPSLDKYVQNFGPRLGSMLRASERAVARTGQGLVQTFLAFLYMGIGHIQLCLRLAVFLAVLLLLKLVIGFFAG